MADCLNNEQQINSNLSESNVDALTSNLDGVGSVTSEMSGESSISSTMYSANATTSNLGSEEPLNSELDLPTTYTYRGSETDNIVVTVDNKGFIISASVKQIKFNSVSDFPEVGSEHLIYIDTLGKTLYGWDSSTSSYYKLVADVKVPTKLSEFENDGDGINPFITKVVSDLQNYYTKSETYTQDEIKNLVSAIPKFSIKVVTELPTTDISETTVYLIPSGSEEQNLYIEYIYVNDTWEKLGEQRIDLSNYPTRTELQEILNITLRDYLSKELFNDFLTDINRDISNIKNNTNQIVGEDGQFMAGGASSATDDGVAIGGGASSTGGSAIGYGSKSALGGAVGLLAQATDGFAGGFNAKAELDAIQLGAGTNSSFQSLQVYSDNIYNAHTHTLTVKNIELDGEDIKDLIGEGGGGGTKIIWEVWE